MYHLRYSDSSPLPSNAWCRLADARSKSPPALERAASMPALKLNMGSVKKKLVFEEDEASELVNDMLAYQWNELSRVLNASQEPPDVDEYLSVVSCINVLEELKSDMEVSSAIRSA